VKMENFPLGTAVALKFFPVVIILPIDPCAINVKSSICSETTKYFLYKCHELFVNSHVMITVKSCFKCRSVQ